jgi:hypothetical protein
MQNYKELITKERLKVMLFALLGLGIVYLFTKTIGSLLLASIGVGFGWWLNSKYGEMLKERLNLKK